MKQRVLKMKLYNRGLGIANNIPANHKLFAIFMWSFGALAICYVLIIGNMILNIIERKSFEARSRTLISEVGEMELRFLSLSGSIDADLGQALGFVESKEYFATRQSLGSVSLLNNEL